MNGVGAGFARNAQNIFYVEIRFDRPDPRADLIAFICLEAMQCKVVFLGVDRRGLDPELRRPAHYPDGDFTSVCNEKLFYSPGVHHCSFGLPNRTDQKYLAGQTSCTKLRSGRRVRKTSSLDARQVTTMRPAETHAVSHA